MESTTTRLNSILANATGDPAAALAKTQRSLLKLAFALRGQSDELDQVLVRLASSLRSGSRDVDITQIVDSAVTALNNGTPTRAQQNVDSLRRVAEHVLGVALHLAPALAEPLQHARQQLSAAGDEASIQSILLGVVRQAAEGGMVAHDSIAEEVALSTVVSLLTQLHLPDTMATATQAVQQQLAKRPPPTSVEATRAVANLVSRSHDASAAEIDRMSGFLQQVVGKIAQLQQQLHLVNNASDKSIRESEALNESVTGHVRDIQVSVDTATDIGDLKTTIAENLHSLHQGVDEFVSSARQRRSETEELLTRLNTQLSMLEGETTSLSEGLVRERERASTDSLTGLPNRRALDAHLGSMNAAPDRQGKQVSVLVVDIDHFKTINDGFGHQAGDRVLKGVADLLRSQLRAQDFIARYGGEEFVVVLPGAPIDQAAIIAERMRAHVQSCRFRSGDKVVPVTVSLGMASLEDDEAIETALERADRAMYSAKRQGRNRTARAADDGGAGQSAIA
jgi:diguanylate cyclase (GGDEF)-like protein